MYEELFKVSSLIAASECLKRKKLLYRSKSGQFSLLRTAADNPYRLSISRTIGRHDAVSNY